MVPFRAVVCAGQTLTDKFLLNWLEFLSFAISGLPAGTCC